MRPFVVDTSILVKWLHTEKEEHIAEAERLLHDAHLENVVLYTPDLAIYEVGNALLKGKQLTAEQICEHLAKLLSQPLAVIPFTKELIFRAAYLAERFELTVYDASFSALAAIKRCPLITENVKHQGKVGEIKVTHIADYPGSLK